MSRSSGLADSRTIRVLAVSVLRFVERKLAWDDVDLQMNFEYATENKGS
jgi:hypothetical protein